MTVKLSISFTDAHARMIGDAVASGQYASASEVVREALRQRDRAIDAAIADGVASGFAEARPIGAIIGEAKRGWKKGERVEVKAIKARRS